MTGRPSYRPRSSGRRRWTRPPAGAMSPPTSVWRSSVRDTSRSISNWRRQGFVLPPTLTAARRCRTHTRADEHRESRHRMTARPDVLNAAEPVRIGLGGDAITLVEGATFCRSDRWGDILVGRPHGRFFRDAGVLSRWHLGLDAVGHDGIEQLRAAPL